MNVKSFLYPLFLLPGWRTIKQYPAGTIFLDISWSTFAHAGVYIAARVNSDKQSYEVAAVDLHLALHPTLALTSCPSSLTEQAVSIVASIMFTQQQKTTNHLPGSVNWRVKSVANRRIVVPSLHERSHNLFPFPLSRFPLLLQVAECQDHLGHQ